MQNIRLFCGDPHRSATKIGQISDVSTDMGYSRVPTPEPRAYARPTALREGADDGTYIANADLPHHPIDPYESCEPLVLVLLVPDIARICMESRQGYVPV